MYILLPFAVSVITLITMGIIFLIYYETKVYLRKTNKFAILPYIRHLYHTLFARNEVDVTNNEHSCWKDPYFYIGIIWYIAIGIIAYLAGIFSLIGIGYLIMLLD